MFWHVIGVVIIIGILAFVPEAPPELRLRLHRADQQLRLPMSMFWWYVLPTGFLLTMYTITGYDASAHVAEETHGGGAGCGQGRLAVGAHLGDHRLVRAAGDHLRRHRHQGVNDAAGSSISVFTSADMNQNWAEAIIFIAGDRPVLLRHGVRHQLLAHVLRVLARPGHPGQQLWSRVSAKGVPATAVIGSCALAFLIVSRRCRARAPSSRRSPSSRSPRSERSGSTSPT